MDRPETLGRFVIDGSVPVGGPGEVLSAHDPTSGEPAEMFVLPVDSRLGVREQDEHARRFAREVEAAVALDHPGLVRLLDGGVEGGRVWLASEPCAVGGGSSTPASGDVLSIREVGRAAVRLGAALDHVHEQGVWHRRLAPRFVSLDPESGARARLTGVLGRSITTLAGLGPGVVGTGHLAPEQLAGHGDGPAADQFALATVLYEWLAGASAFAGDDAADEDTVAVRVLHRAPTPPSRIRPELGVAADAVFARALAKDPAERYPSCSEMATALNAALHGRPAGTPRHRGARIEAATSDSPEPVGLDAFGQGPSASSRALSSPWRGPALLASVALLVLVVAVVWLVGRDSAPRDGLGRVTPSRGPGDDSEPLSTYRIESRPSGARVTLDGRQLAATTPTALSLEPDVRHTLLLELDGRESVAWAFVPEELPEQQQRTGRLFFPLRERPAVIVAPTTETGSPVAGGETDESDGADAAAPVSEPLEPVEIRGRGFERPRVIERVEPALPAWAAEAGLQEYVVLEVVVDRHGRVRDGRPLQSVHPELERMALEAALRWRLEPATRDGEPTDVFFPLTVRFRSGAEEGNR